MIRQKKTELNFEQLFWQYQYSFRPHDKKRFFFVKYGTIFKVYLWQFATNVNVLLLEVVLQCT